MSEGVYRDFEKQIGYRERHRQRKKEKEDTYHGKVETFLDEKFEKIKREAISFINTDAVNLKPGCVRNVFENLLEERKSEDDEEIKEETAGQID